LLLFNVVFIRSLDFFKRFCGHRIVPIEIGSMMRQKMKEELMSFGSFADEFLQPSSQKKFWKLSENAKVAYLAQHPLFDQIPSLLQDIIIEPSLCSETSTLKNIWMGTGGTRTPLHYDSYDNLLVQIVGIKYVRIYMQSETDKLYVMRSNHSSSYGYQGNMSQIHCEEEDYDKYPLTRDAAYMETVLFPGDCLFIPSRVWHYVRSLSTSISVNYWW